MNLPSDFKELLEEFAREGVEHVVIGVVQLERIRARP